MRIAVTGSSGFIGTHLVKKLKSSNFQDISIFDKKRHSLLSFDSLYNLFKDVDVVYHLAALNDSNEKYLFDVNVIGTINVLKAIQRFANKNCKIIFASSFSLYKTPAKKTVVTEKFQLQPQSLYGLSKKMAEEAIQYYGRTVNTPFVIARISNPYGPGVPAFRHSAIGTFFELVKLDRQVTIHGSGNQTRDFIYIDDVISALLKCKKKSINNEVINIASGTSVSINDTLGMIGKITNKKTDVIKIPHAKAIGYWNVDNAKAKKVLNWQPKTGIMDGLKKTWKYSIK